MRTSPLSSSILEPRLMPRLCLDMPCVVALPLLGVVLLGRAWERGRGTLLPLVRVSRKTKQSHHYWQGDKKPVEHDIERVEDHQKQPYQPMPPNEPNEGGEEQRQQIDREPNGSNNGRTR